MNESNQQAFFALVTSWERGGQAEVCAQIRKLFTDSTVWVQPGLPTTTGVDEAIAIVQSWGAGFASYEVEIRHIASTENVVLAERFETFKHADGSIFLALPVVGVAEFHDGKITTWREFYDSAALPGLNR